VWLSLKERLLRWSLNYTRRERGVKGSGVGSDSGLPSLPSTSVGKRWALGLPGGSAVVDGRDVAGDDLVARIGSLPKTGRFIGSPRSLYC